MLLLHNSHTHQHQYPGHATLYVQLSPFITHLIQINRKMQTTLRHDIKASKLDHSSKHLQFNFTSGSPLSKSTSTAKKKKKRFIDS